MRKALRHLGAELKRALRFVVVLLFDSCWATRTGEGSSVHESTVSHQAGFYADQHAAVVTMRDSDTGKSASFDYPTRQVRAIPATSGSKT